MAIERTPERLIFYAFDLLYLNGIEVRNEPLIDRRSRLQVVVGEHDPAFSVQFSEHVIGSGPEFFDIACAAELEGIVSKKITSRYCSGRSKAWLKSKAFVESEFVVIGYKRAKGRSCALLARNTDEGLQYAGSAFVTLLELERELFWRTIETLQAPGPSTPANVRAAAWVRPELQVTAKHLRCSEDLRHATLSGLDL
jgi:ATP-dependent DNA ligase